MMMRIVVIATLLAVVFFAASSGWAQSGALVQFETIATGQQTRMRDAARVVIRDQMAWATLWRRHTGAEASAPAVDFALEMVIAIFAGESQMPRVLSIRRVTRESDGYVVSYALRDARPILETDGLPMTNAFAILRLPASPLPVRFLQIKMPPVVRNSP